MSTTSLTPEQYVVQQLLNGVSILEIFIDPQAGGLTLDQIIDIEAKVREVQELETPKQLVLYGSGPAPTLDYKVQDQTDYRGINFIILAPPGLGGQGSDGNPDYSWFNQANLQNLVPPVATSGGSQSSTVNLNVNIPPPVLAEPSGLQAYQAFLSNASSKQAFGALVGQDPTNPNCLFFAGDFLGAGLSQLLIYLNSNANWYLGLPVPGVTNTPPSLMWANSPIYHGTPDVLDNKGMLAADLSGNQSTLLCYSQQTSNWWLAQINNGQLQWGSPVGNTPGLNPTDLPGEGSDPTAWPFLVGDWLGRGQQNLQVLTLDASANSWWIGSVDASGHLTPSVIPLSAGKANPGSGPTVTLDSSFFSQIQQFWVGSFIANQPTVFLGFNYGTGGGYFLIQWSGSGFTVTPISSSGALDLNNAILGEYFFAVGDFDGDGADEILVYAQATNQTSSGYWYLGQISANAITWTACSFPQGQQQNASVVDDLQNQMPLFVVGDFLGTGSSEQALFYGAGSNNIWLFQLQGGAINVGNTSPANFKPVETGGNFKLLPGRFTSTTKTQALLYFGNTGDWQLLEWSSLQSPASNSLVGTTGT